MTLRNGMNFTAIDYLNECSIYLGVRIMMGWTDFDVHVDGYSAFCYNKESKPFLMS